MAKKEKQSAHQHEPTRPADAVRSAVEQAFAATAGGAASTRDRAQEIVDDIASAASRVREVLGPLDDLRGLRTEVDSLARRVAALEVRVAASSAPATATATDTAPSDMESSPGGTR